MDYEELSCTCLDRAEIALRQTGQHHCALMVRELSEEFTAISKKLDMNPYRVVDLFRLLIEWTGADGLPEVLGE